MATTREGDQMSLFDWIARLFGGRSAESPGDVADRLDRVADRFSHAGNAAAASAARTAAARARLAPTVDAARQIEVEFLRSQGLRPDGQPLKPVLGRGPDETEYVRYGNTLRAGGSRAWRYNNPGYVRCSSRSASYGALTCDGEFAIFPNYATGVSALRQSLRDEYPNHTVRDALRLHLPPEANVDADRICEEAGLEADTTVEDMTDDDCGALNSTLENEPGWSAGEEFDRGTSDNPAWVETTWTAVAAVEAAGIEAAAADASPADETALTDNS
jgi:hypothetical protein